jgi:hypothetical protein
MNGIYLPLFFSPEGSVADFALIIMLSLVFSFRVLVS